jgi:hypothetical protein
MKRLLPVIGGLLIAPLALVAFAPQPNLEARLRAQFAWTTVDQRTWDVIHPGCVLVVQRDGISTSPANAPFHAQHNYRDGQLKRSALNFFTQNEATTGRFVAGDRVFVTKTEVKGDNVVLSVLSADAPESMRAKASVSFEFPKGSLANLDFENVAVVIREVFAPEPEVLEQQPPVTEQRSAAPPPTKPDLHKNIELGATPEQVWSILGPPKFIADLGGKLIYVYPDLKVTFLNERVSDVK